jgi:hypothetical protein
VDEFLEHLVRRRAVLRGNQPVQDQEGAVAALDLAADQAGQDLEAPVAQLAKRAEIGDLVSDLALVKE